MGPMGKIFGLVALILVFPAFGTPSQDCGMTAYCKSRPDAYKKFVRGPVQTTRPFDQIVKEVKESITTILLGGRSFSKITPQESKIISAIQRVPLLDSKTNEACEYQCRYSLLGFYFPGKGVCLCDSLRMYAEEFVIMIAGHELAHAAGICSFSETGLRPGEHPFDGDTNSPVACLQKLGISKKPDPPPPNLTNDNLCMWSKNSLNEATADLMGFAVLDSHLKAKGLRQTPENWDRLFGFFMFEACQPTPYRPFDHISAPLRIGQISMMFPEIRKAIGCKDYGAPLDCRYKIPAPSLPQTDSKTIY